MKKKVVFILIIGLAVIFIYNHVNKKHRNIANEEAIVSLDAIDFHSFYTNNKDEFNKKYLDKVITLKGSITLLETNGVILDNKNYVTFIDEAKSELKINDEIVIKGRYVGYDDFLEQLKIDQATIINNKY